MAAAGLAAVAVTLVVSRLLPGAALDEAPLAATAPAVVAAAAGLAPDQGPVLRDLRLDEFLRVHQIARGGLPVGAPGGSLQRADLQMTVGAGR